MAIVIDANMILFADRMHISSSRMVEEYGLKTVDEIIEAEAEKGNQHAIKYAQEMYNSPAKLIKVFRLADVENKFVLLNKMDYFARLRVLPMLEREDLVMGLYFFTQDKLLEMLQNTNMQELVNVMLEAFPVEAIISMFTEDDLAMFFQQKELERFDIMYQLRCMPTETMIKFIENVTGKSPEDTDVNALFTNIENLPEDQFRDFMSMIDPDVQRQLALQLTTDKTEYLQLFQPKTYTDMLGTMMKADMVKPMIALQKDTLVKMLSILPDDLMSIVCAQVDTRKFAEFLLMGHKKVLEDAWMI